MMIKTKTTFCRICEATCGLKVEVENNTVIKIHPDRDHVVSKGFVCVKGTHFDSVQNSPDRITTPMKRVGTRWQAISWEQATTEIGERVKAIQKKYGKHSVANFVGAPGGANVVAPLFRNAFYEALGSDRMYGTATTDTVNKFRVNEDMYGQAMRLAYPDVNRTQFLLVIGANPAISGNTLYHLPRAKMRFKEIVKNGGRVVFLNPRRVESATIGEHLFIRPDTDVFFLAAFVNEMIQQVHYDTEHIARYFKNFDQLRDVVTPWTAETQARVTGVDAETLRDLVAAHAKAEGAALNMATGVNQGRSGTLCFWLLECINAISGNLDKPGGTLMGIGLFDMARELKSSSQMNVSYVRKDGLPTVVGQHPSSMLADDILSDDEPVKALIVEASNPLLACANPNGRLDKAFESLELLVSIDLFRNEVGNLAHYILPAPTWLERADIPYAIQSMVGNMPTPYMTYSDPVVEAPEQVRHEWWIYSRLAETCGVTMFNNKLLNALLKLNTRLAVSSKKWLRSLAVTPETLLNGMLKKGGSPSRKAFLQKYPGGILLEDNKGGNFLGTDRVLTDDAKVDLAPEAYLTTFRDVMDDRFNDELNNRDKLKLIGKRELKRINSSMSNSVHLVKKASNYVYVTAEDADKHGLTDGDMAFVQSDYGQVVIPVSVSDELMAGVVAIPHCWGHSKADGLKHAMRHPGVNTNLLAGDGINNIEALSGMSFLSGITVTIQKYDKELANEKNKRV